MSKNKIPTDGYAVKLTGHQVNYIRSKLKESQLQMSKRMAISQPAITRLEATGTKKNTGPLVILLRLLADENGIEIPENPDGNFWGGAKVSGAVSRVEEPEAH